MSFDTIAVTPGRTHRLLFWPGVIAGAYVVCTGLVAAAEYVSELAKIQRGTFTDTFSPYVFSDLLTYPMSALHLNAVDYPLTFDDAVFTHLVRRALVPTLLDIVVEAVAIAAVVLLWVSVRRFRSAR